MDSITFDLFSFTPSAQLFHHPIKPATTVDILAVTLVALLATAYLLQGIVWDRPDPYSVLYFERPQQRAGSGNGQVQSERNIAKALEQTNKKVVVFWGSQSGTAERFAEQLAKECRARFSLEAIAADLSDYDPPSLASMPSDKIAIFILSTYGEGDPSDNAAGLWEWVQKSEDVSLKTLQYAAFGLGNRNYKYFNRVVDVVTQALGRYGAVPLLPLAKADDANGTTEEDFLSWKDDLFSVFRKHLNLEEKIGEYQPTVVVQEDDSLEPIDLHHGEPTHSRDNPKSAAACSPIAALSVKNSRELFSSKERNCLHLELDLTDQLELHYKTGDHLAVWPTNPNEEVDRILTALGRLERRDTPVSINAKEASVKVKIPTPTTASALFRHYLEVCAPVSRRVVLELAQFAPTPGAEAYMLKFGRDKNLYADLASHTHLTFGRLLKLASPIEPWSRLPLSYVLEALPTLQPRYYSISSSSVISPRRPAITALVSNKELSGDSKQSIPGLTTNYLLAMSRSHTSSPAHSQNTKYDFAGPAGVLQGAKVFAHIRKSKFKLPITGSCPIIMVAAGTGIAPFRAFLTERAKLQTVGKPVGQMILFFGCRHPDEDFIYREELEKMQASLGTTLRIVTAFSRLEAEPKIYVQDRVEEHGDEVAGLLEAGASFYICGRASMAREVGKTLGEMMRKTKGWGDDEVKEWSEGLKKKGKWREDVWG